MEEILKAVSTVGYPIAVSIYVLMRLEKTMKENTEATKENIQMNRELFNYFKGTKNV